ncbi:hypothetical protein ASE74_03765 [Pedobacter sp. Leaf216]|nr:hypothetical protein ASE74_03765 [Pedobacter sp. Leaf216]
MPQAAQGLGYTFQSFLMKDQKRISTAISHAKRKPLRLCFGWKIPMVCGETDHGDFPKRVVKLITRLQEG